MQRGVGDTYAQDPGIEPFAAEPMLSRTPAVAISLANSHGSRRPGSRNSPGRGNRTFCTRRPSCRCMIRNCSNHRRRRRTRYLSTCSRDRRTTRENCRAPDALVDFHTGVAKRQRRAASPAVRRSLVRGASTGITTTRACGTTTPGTTTGSTTTTIGATGTRRPECACPSSPASSPGPPPRSELSPLAARGSIPESCPADKYPPHVKHPSVLGNSACSS